MIITINYLLRSGAVYTVTGMVVVRKVMSLSGSRHIKGGTMEKRGYDFVNIGGEEVYTGDAPTNVSAHGEG